jgi:hypothetical protein
MGTLVLPSRFRIFRIVDDAIYGAARDENGVERVLRLRLRRDGSGLSRRSTAP